MAIALSKGQFTHLCACVMCPVMLCRLELFNLINELPTCYEVVSGKARAEAAGQKRPGAAGGGQQKRSRAAVSLSFWCSVLFTTVCLAAAPGCSLVCWCGCGRSVCALVRHVGWSDLVASDLVFIGHMCVQVDEDEDDEDDEWRDGEGDPCPGCKGLYK